MCMLCVCYVHVMCMLFVCNMMLTLQRRELSRKTKSPTSSERPLRRGHGRRAQRCTLDVRQGRQGTDGTRAERAEATLRGTARKTLISQRSDERNRPVTDLSQTCHSPRMGSQAQCGKWPFKHFGIWYYMLVHLIIFGADFRWLLMAFESDWMLFHIAPDPVKFVTFVLLLLLSLREIGNNVCLVGFFHQTGMSQASFIRWMTVQTASITSWLQAIRSWPQIVQWQNCKTVSCLKAWVNVKICEVYIQKIYREI